MSEHVVSGYADLVADRKLGGAEPDRVGRALQACEGREDRLVAWLPDWLAEEKEFPAVESGSNVIAGVVDHETEKAYHVVSGAGADTWLPKSVVRVYRLAPGAELSIPQHGLTDFAEEEGSA